MFAEYEKELISIGLLCRRSRAAEGDYCISRVIKELGARAKQTVGVAFREQGAQLWPAGRSVSGNPRG
jgi:hypothetical protein